MEVTLLEINRDRHMNDVKCLTIYEITDMVNTSVAPWNLRFVSGAEYEELLKDRDEAYQKGKDDGYRERARHIDKAKIELEQENEKLKKENDLMNSVVEMNEKDIDLMTDVENLNADNYRKHGSDS